jgi:hypothetical protein
VSGETWLGVAENCPNLECEDLFGVHVVMMGSLSDGLKKRMKRLSSLKVNCIPAR